MTRLRPVPYSEHLQREAATMGLAYNTYLNSAKIYGCKNCKAHLANHDDIISRVSLFRITLSSIITPATLQPISQRRLPRPSPPYPRYPSPLLDPG